jgi:hypothetical protein
MKNPIRLVLLGVPAALLIGCQSEGPSWGGIKHDLTPELEGLATTHGDNDRIFHVNENQNLRMFWDDVYRTFYFDHASRLTPHPLADSSGLSR